MAGVVTVLLTLLSTGDTTVDGDDSSSRMVVDADELASTSVTMVVILH